MKKNTQSTKQPIRTIFDKFFAYLVLLLVVISFVVGYFLIIDGNYYTYKQSKYVILPQLIERTKFLNQKLALDKQMAQQVFNPQEERLISLALPSEFDFSNTLIQLTSLAKKNNINVVSLERIEVKNNKATSTPQNGNGLVMVNLKMKLIVDDYNNFKNFLRDLEVSVNMFDVNSLLVSTGNPESSVNLITYYYPEYNYGTEE